MSFFKDFKDDLSQAVNELMPEEGGAATAPQMVDTISEPSTPIGQDDLAELIKGLDEETASPAEPMFEKAPEPAPAVQSTAVPVPEAAPVSAPEPAAAPAAEAAPAPAPAPAPAVEPAPEPVEIPVYTEEAKSEPEKVIEPVFSQEPIKNEVPNQVTEPIFSQEPVKTEVPNQVTEPIFSENTEAPAPINTIAEGANETGVIPNGMTIVGDITTNGSLDIMGTVKGNVTVAGKLNITGNIEGDSKADEVFADGARIIGEVTSNGSIKVGQSSVIKGNMCATSAVLAGAVKGDIDVKGPVVLDSTAIIMGNIKSKSIQINNGAAIEGLCSQCYAEVSPSSFFTEG
ncbi:MAG: polymer-forming cytoskeletal protein [Lachnospiraceae bacterium]|nr:polymer-forming cytoskeletal protein [Lachnospiraceae bacterium]